MLLHYQICICISGHSKFDMDLNIFCKIALTLNCWLVCLLGCVMCNTERPTTFAILEKKRKN